MAHDPSIPEKTPIREDELMARLGACCQLAGALSMTLQAGSQLSCRACMDRARDRRRERGSPRLCSRMKRSRQAGSLGEQFAPVIATNRPPGSSRRSPEAIWRSAASATGPETFAITEVSVGSR